jgi:hypothetical protein
MSLFNIFTTEVDRFFCDLHNYNIYPYQLLAIDLLLTKLGLKHIIKIHRIERLELFPAHQLKQFVRQLQIVEKRGAYRESRNSSNSKSRSIFLLVKRAFRGIRVIEHCSIIVLNIESCITLLRLSLFPDESSHRVASYSYSCRAFNARKKESQSLIYLHGRVRTKRAFDWSNPLRTFVLNNECTESKSRPAFLDSVFLTLACRVR